MTFEENNLNTPVTNQVRDRRGDYLAAVEELEESHVGLMKVLEFTLPYLTINIVREAAQAALSRAKAIEAIKEATL